MSRLLPIILVLLLPVLAWAHISAEPTYEDSGFLFWAGCVVIVFFYVYGRVASLFTRKRGEIVSFEASLKEKCECNNIPVRVRLESGEDVLAEVAGCTLCYHQMRVGSQVSLDYGPSGRLVIQQPARMSAGERFSLAMESCSAGCIREREARARETAAKGGSAGSQAPRKTHP